MFFFTKSKAHREFVKFAVKLFYKNHFNQIICGYFFYHEQRDGQEFAKFVKFAVKTFFKNHFHLWLKNREMVKEFVKISEISGKQFFIKMKSKHLI